MSEIKVVRLHRFDGDGKLKAFADVAIGDYIIKGFRVVEGKNGVFLGMPQEKSKDGKWFNAFYASTKEAKQSLIDAVMSAFES